MGNSNHDKSQSDLNSSGVLPVCVRCSNNAATVRECKFWGAKKQGIEPTGFKYFTEVVNGSAGVCDTCASEERRTFDYRNLFWRLSSFAPILLLPFMSAIAGLYLVTFVGKEIASVFDLAPLLILFGLLANGVLVFLVIWAIRRPFGAMVVLRMKVDELRTQGYVFFGEGHLLLVDDNQFGIETSDWIPSVYYDVELRPIKLGC